jgi:hypothetical protein
MEETRSGLTDKLAALENQVGGTVQAATNAVEVTKEAVTNTVETVKETVAEVTGSVEQAVEGVKESFDETVKTVTETLNPCLQCERHPWAVFSGAVAVGWVGTMLLSGSSRQHSTASQSGGSTRRNPTPAQPEPEPTSNQSAEPSVGGAVGGWLWEQLGGLKGLALGAMMGVVRDLVTQALPENLKERVSGEVDKITKSLGGEPIKGPLLRPHQEEAEPSRDNGHEQQYRTNPSSPGRSETTAGRASQPALAGQRR